MSEHRYGKTTLLGFLRRNMNMRIRGLSGTLYQIDGLVDEIIMIEAKDYQKRNSKVPRADLQKQEGALSDLPCINMGGRFCNRFYKTSTPICKGFYK